MREESAGNVSRQAHTDLCHTLPSLCGHSTRVDFTLLYNILLVFEATLCASNTKLVLVAQILQLLQCTAGRVAQGSGHTGPSSYAASLPLVLSWPATSITVRFQSSDFVLVKLQLFTGGTYSTGNPRAQNRFRFLLDGIPADQLVFATGNFSASGLGPGLHELTIIKLTEALYGVAVLESIQLAANGR